MLLVNNFDVGQSSGTTITTGNSGGQAQNAFDSTLGTAPTFDSAHAHSGSISMKMVAPGGMIWNTTSLGTPTDIWGRAYLYFPSTPSIQIPFIRLYTPTSATTQWGSVRVTNTGQVQSQILGTAQQISTNTVTTGGWTRIEFHAHTAASGIGTLDTNFYTSADSTTITESLTQSSTATGVNDGTFEHVSWGVNALITYWLDDIQVNDSGFPGSSVVPLQAPHVVSVSAMAAVK